MVVAVSNDDGDSSKSNCTSSQGDASRGPPRRSRVVFDRVTVFEFSPEVGHNPAVSRGVPIALNYDDCVCERIYATLDAHEQRRGRSRPKRAGRELVLDRNYREQM